MQKRSFCQDRLGTNIGKTQKKMADGQKIETGAFVERAGGGAFTRRDLAVIITPTIKETHI
jgi:hypothetical protein